MTAQLSVRLATPEDRAALWDWYRQEFRYTMLKRRPLIAERRAHDRWFADLQASSNTVLAIGVVDIIRVGAVRFERLGDYEFEASLVLKAAHWGRGYAPLMVREGATLLPAWRSVVVQSRVPNRQLMNQFLASGFSALGASSESPGTAFVLRRPGA